MTAHRDLPSQRAEGLPAYEGPVIWVTPYLQRCGTEHHILYLLQSVRWSIPPVLLGPPGPLAEAFEEAGAVVRLFEDPTGNWWRGLRSFRRVLRQALAERRAPGSVAALLRPVVHVHAAAELAWLAGKPARQAGASLLFTAHGYFGQAARSSYRIAAWLLRRARVPVIAVSADEKSRWVQSGFPPERVSVIHNGVPDLNVGPARRPEGLEGSPTRCAARDALAAELGVRVPADAFLVGAAARLEPQKGIGVLIEALARLAPAHPSLHCVIMGDGSLRAQLEARARRSGLEARVFFAGSVRLAARYFPAFDVLCMPSVDESFGLALVEGMAAGCAVVASRVGGIPEVIRDGVEGLLVPPGDPDRLAEALQHLLSEPTRLAELRRAARRRYEVAFTARRMASATLEVYRRLATTARSRHEARR